MTDFNLTYPLNIRLTHEEINALALMAHDDLRDLKTQAYFSLRSILIERGYLPNPTCELSTKATA